jgi:pimeloyl-ACP methyl ester carboxylesterase
MTRTTPLGERWRLIVAAAASLAIGAATLVTGTAWADSGSQVVSIPVSFDVVMRNDSGIPCDTSNPLTSLVSSPHVTVRGHVTGPRDELNRDHVDGTVYSHGDADSETFWRYPRDEDYNYADQMARRGHVSVSFDRLGYGKSDRPNGNLICWGTEATVLHQIIGQLRHGDYHGPHTPRFTKLGVVGKSSSGFIAEQEAAAFHDIDALGLLGSGSLSVTPLSVQRTAEKQLRCFTDSHHGYAGFEANGEQFRHDHLYNVRPDIAHYLVSHRTIDACGATGFRNAGQSLIANPIRNSTIRVPVLVLFGANDKLFQHPGWQAKTYTQSRKVTVGEIPDTGHSIAFSREHYKFYDRMDDWLDDNHL